MFKKLRISLIFSNLVVIKSLNSNHRMHNLYANFVRILEVCKQYSQDLVNDKGNMPRCGVIPKFSDLEVIALSLTQETMGYDSECYLFGQLEDYRSKLPHLISRRQYNDRRKYTAALCEEIRKRVAKFLDGGEDVFIVDSKPVKVCQPSRGSRNTMGKTCPEKAPDFGYCATQALYYFGYKLHAVCGAGVGTASMMHGASKNTDPIREDLIAMLGPAIDSGLVCTLTSIPIIIAGNYVGLTDPKGLYVALGAWGQLLPGIGHMLLMVIVFFFAFSTMFSYSYYGQKCTNYLFGAHNVKWYNYYYLAMIVVAAMIPLKVMVSIMDLAFALMALCTMFTIIRLAPRVKRLMKTYFKQ